MTARGTSARALIVLAAVAGCDASVDPAWLTGTWVFAEGSEVIVCGQIPVDVANTVVRLRETRSGVELDLGCRCRLAMNGDGTLSTSGQSCKLLAAPSAEPYDMDATVASWTLTPGSSPGSLIVDASGSAIPIGLERESASPMCSFEIRGELVRTDSPRPDCGASETAVGVYSIAAQCPIGAGTDGVLIVMVSDVSTGCTAVSGASGEPHFPPPGSVKSLPACTPGVSQDTRLHFCRVDGQLFRPFPPDAGTASTYAVLKLGAECPAGAVEVIKKINNDDGTRENGFLGDIRPNVVSNALPAGTFTELHFCLFPPADDSDTPTLSSFPELGFGYAVFHDFEGFQPPWVQSKYWRRSDDESSGSRNSTVLPDGSSEGVAIDLFERMVEDPPPTSTSMNDTIFDFAMVR